MQQSVVCHIMLFQVSTHELAVCKSLRCHTREINADSLKKAHIVLVQPVSGMILYSWYATH